MSETKAEYCQGVFENERRDTLRSEPHSDLQELIYNYMSDKESDDWKEIMIQFIIENSLDLRP